jgi:hypothetical protein
MQNHRHFLLDPDHEPLAKGARPWLPIRGHGCILLFVGVFALAGLCFAVALVRQWAEFAILSTNYAETEGQVRGRRIESDEGTTYYVTYRFVVDDKTYTPEDSVSKKTYHSLEDLQYLTVRYARRDPTISTIEPGRVGGLLALTGFCLFWNGIVFVVTRPLVLEILKRRRLARKGQRLEGEILYCSGYKDSDGDFVVAVRYGFRSPQTGARIEDKDSQIRKDLKGAPLPPPGTAVHVLYLNDETYMVL